MDETGTQAIEEFLAESYSDEALVALDRACEANEVDAWNPHRCLLARSDAGYRFHHPKFGHFCDAEQTVMDIQGRTPWSVLSFVNRNSRLRLAAVLLPLIRAEMERRAFRTVASVEHELQMA